MNRVKAKEILKDVLIIIIVSIVIESAIVLYNLMINKLYEKCHFIGNETIEIKKEDIEVESDETSCYLKVDNLSQEKIYNISLALKDKNQDVYLRVIFNNDAKFMPKENADATKFKVYFVSGMNTESFIINYPKEQIDLDNIQKIIINDNIDYMPSISFSLMHTVIIFCIILAVYLIVKLYKLSNGKERKIKKEYIFLALSLVVGIILVFINVPQTRYDEHAHFWRAYEISSGHIISRTSNELPNSVINLFSKDDGSYPNHEMNYGTIIKKLGDRLNVDDKQEFPVGATGSLTPISYIPQLVGITIGRILNLSPIVILWLGRLTNLLVYILLVFIAIKIMPFEKWKSIIMIIALLPMTMNLAATVSPDTIIIGVTLLAISYLFYLKVVSEKITLKNIILLGILFMIPAVCKIVYFPLCLLVFILPKDKFESKIKRILYYIVTIVIVFGTYFVFNNLVSKGDYAIAIRTNMTEQILFTLSDLWRDFSVALNTFYCESSSYFFELIGGWNTINIVSVAIFVILLYVIFNKDEESTQYVFTKKEKIIFVTIIVIEVLGVTAAMYLGWTQAKQTVVEGIQGRYFLPIIPLLCMLLCKNKIDCKIKNKELKFIIAIILIYIVVFGFSIRSYIG